MTDKPPQGRFSGPRTRFPHETARAAEGIETTVSTMVIPAAHHPPPPVASAPIVILLRCQFQRRSSRSASDSLQIRRRGVNQLCLALESRGNSSDLLFGLGIPALFDSFASPRHGLHAVAGLGAGA
jgi:hypothetical protein